VRERGRHDQIDLHAILVLDERVAIVGALGIGQELMVQIEDGPDLREARIDRGQRRAPIAVVGHTNVRVDVRQRVGVAATDAAADDHDADPIVRLRLLDETAHDRPLQGELVREAEEPLVAQRGSGSTPPSASR